MERRIDFSRKRHMLCGICGHRWMVGLDWIDRWEQGKETCPGCGTSCEHEDSPRVTVDPGDPALDDDQVARFTWHHTSTQRDWPKKYFDPAAALTRETRLMMGGDERVAAWAARQRAKALHVGTYEAAVHNMLRRISDQADHGSQFYLYRVRLKPSVALREGWLIDPSNFVGDVVLDEVCPPGIDVARYLNHHEDPGGLSLALGRDAIASVQQVAVPLLDAWDDSWVRDAVAARGRERDRCTRDGQMEQVYAAVLAASGLGPRAREGPGRPAARQSPGPVHVRRSIRRGRGLGAMGSMDERSARPDRRPGSRAGGGRRV
ncbi:hypothetical protein [Georgenia sunbinii]|uniref:hypothetical protein n=1 Tax=Georgenia sunbinii TaxID=3117728 RepID=UPI002F267914